MPSFSVSGSFIGHSILETTRSVSYVALETHPESHLLGLQSVELG